MLLFRARSSVRTPLGEVIHRYHLCRSAMGCLPRSTIDHFEGAITEGRRRHSRSRLASAAAVALEHVDGVAPDIPVDSGAAVCPLSISAFSSAEVVW